MNIKYEYIMSYLNSISRLAVLEGAKDCQQAIEDFMYILRYKRNIKDEICTIDQEIKVIDKMISIYKARNGNNFLLIINKKYKNQGIYIPKNMIMTFVENCLEHAYVGSNDSWELKIIIECNDEKCNILIQDNGIGFNVNNIYSKPNDFKSIINMMNKVNEVGEISIKSSKDIGTKVQVSIFREKIL